MSPLWKEPFGVWRRVPRVTGVTSRCLGESYPLACTSRGKRAGWLWVETCWVRLGLGDSASLPQPPFQYTRGQGVHRMWLPICPPPVSAAHASARFQTSKNVKHVDARSVCGGDGRDAYHRRWLSSGLAPALSFLAVLHPEPPSPSPHEEKGQYGGLHTPSPSLPGGCEGSCKGRQLDWEGSRWPGAQLISC